MIDPQLGKAGWYLRGHSKVRIEIPVDGHDAAPWNGVTDYCRYRENGEILARGRSLCGRMGAGERQVEGLFESFVLGGDGQTIPKAVP